MLKAINIHKSFGSIEVLKGVDLSVEKGEVVSLVGSSGAGKSTLLHILGTLDTPDQGEVEIAGERTANLNGDSLANFRNRNIGFVFQFHHLLPEFNALENVCIPAFIQKLNRQEAEKRGEELLNLLGLSHRITHKPGELSGGEQQRIAVARALMNNPKVVMADEPSGNLDSDNSKQLHKLFFDLRDQLGQTFIIATHNRELAELADRKLVMKDGILAQ